MVYEKNPNENDVICAETNTESIADSVSDDKRKDVFKIGGYNRATATFEMNSAHESKAEVKPKFDLSFNSGPCNYFKSSFARSIVVNNSNRSKSMDYVFPARKVHSTTNESLMQSEASKENQSNIFEEKLWVSSEKEVCLQNSELRKAIAREARNHESPNGSIKNEELLNNQRSDANGKQINDSADRAESVSGLSTNQRYLSGFNERRLDDIHLRPSLTVSCRSSFHRSFSSTNDIDSVMLQSQVTTLQWQLRQAEASRQMYRAVMEQVVSFLQKTHKDLDVLQNRLNGDENLIGSVTRVPRSRSVHAVDTSPTRFSSQKSDLNFSFQKAKSFVQITDPDCPKHGNMYKEIPWQKPRKQQQDSVDVNPSKLSEEAFRLLRTVKTLLNTKEPDLTSRLNSSTSYSSPSNVADVSSASSIGSTTLESDNSDSLPPRESLRGSSIKESSSTSSSVKLKSSRRRMSKEEAHSKEFPPQPSLSSADDESGFSSLNSFQEIGIPSSNSMLINSVSHNYKPMPKYESLQEVGLPKVADSSCKVHRRWSSTSVRSLKSKPRPASFCTNGEGIRVLWV